MTPLFHAIALETTKPMQERRLRDPAGYARRLGDAHFFDVTHVAEMASALGNRFVETHGPSERLAFLPAPLTALEVGRAPNGVRVGLILEDRGELAECRLVSSDGDAHAIAPESFFIGLHAMACNEVVYTKANVPIDGWLFSRFGPFIYGALALINTPRTIGRKQHMPHAGLQRKLAAARGMVGKFPLRAWTEIVLEVRPPRIEGQKVYEARLTGEKCLHFCRAHLRIRNGSLEYVSAHWRGDPALGIKQTRYRLERPAAA